MDRRFEKQMLPTHDLNEDQKVPFLQDRGAL